MSKDEKELAVPQLSPCPLCDSLAVVKDSYHIQCTDCGNKGETFQTINNAVNDWNHRAEYYQRKLFDDDNRWK